MGKSPRSRQKVYVHVRCHTVLAAEVAFASLHTHDVSSTGDRVQLLVNLDILLHPLAYPCNPCCYFSLCSQLLLSVTLQSMAGF